MEREKRAQRVEEDDEGHAGEQGILGDPLRLGRKVREELSCGEDGEVQGEHEQRTRGAHAYETAD